MNNKSLNDLLAIAGSLSDAIPPEKGSSIESCPSNYSQSDYLNFIHMTMEESNAERFKAHCSSCLPCLSGIAIAWDRFLDQRLQKRSDDLIEKHFAPSKISIAIRKVKDAIELLSLSGTVVLPLPADVVRGGGNNVSPSRPLKLTCEKGSLSIEAILKSDITGITVCLSLFDLDREYPATDCSVVTSGQQGLKVNNVREGEWCIEGLLPGMITIMVERNGLTEQCLELKFE